MRLLRGLAVAVAGAVGFSAACARSFDYVPTEQVSALVQGEPASHYNVPPEAPRGDVTLISHGVVSVKPKQGGDSIKAVHVGVTVSNDQDNGAWTFDAREQWFLAPGAPPVSAALISTSTATEAVAVQPGQEQTLDLYFRPPAGFKGNEPRSFDLLWSVRTPSRVVTERTPFEREDPRAGYVVPSMSVGLGIGYGSAWWYDPFYFGYPYPVRYGGYYPSYSHRYPAYVPTYRTRFVAPLPAPPAPGRPPPAAPFASPPSMPSRPHLSAPAPPPPPPPVPSVPSQPNISAPAPR